MTDPTTVKPFPAGSSQHVLGSLLTDLEPSLIRPERLVEPDSWAGHIPFACWLTSAARPRRYVELGVHTGNSYCAVAQTAARYELGTECFGIDHWFGDEQAGLYGEDVYADLKAWHDPRYGHFSRLLRMSFEDGRNHVDDGSVDILHIDGLHTYEAVRTDFETWHSKMSERGIVLFHDTNVHKSDFGVWQYWREIQAQYPTIEFLHSNGLGVAYTGSAPLNHLPPAIRTLFEFTGNENALCVVRDYFCRLGEGLIKEIRLGETRRRGEKSARELNIAYRDLVAIDQDRNRIATDNAVLEQRALKWDRLAVRTGGAIGLDIEDVSVALDRLYNSDNPQSHRDRSILKRQFSELVRSGTFDPRYKDVVLRFAERFGRRLKSRLLRQEAPSEDASIATIRASGLFDESHYLLTGEAKASGRDPLEHYLAIGEKRRVAPSEGFDPDYYARHQADVDESGFGLLRHYILFGQREKRHALPPARRIAIPALPENGRPRVLLLMRDAERSDAVVLAWNIAKSLTPTHDVIAFFEKGGDLRETFIPVCTATIDMPEEPGLQRLDLIAVVEKLANEIRPAFAIAANADTREYVRSLAAANVGVVQLVQEFSSAIRPANGAYNFLPFAHRLVFPAKVVADSFQSEHPYLSRRRFDIVRPGATVFPNSAGWPFGTEGYNETVRRHLKPTTQGRDFLVVGIGDVSARKGTDLFASVAAAAIGAGSTGRRMHFVWIGNGFDPDSKNDFSSLLADQLVRAGINGHFQIVDELDDHAEVFRLADALAVTARLDALPNAAVNAMAAGVPVVCFAKASGLHEQVPDPHSPHLLNVVPYLDVPAMAAHLIDLADTQDEHINAGKDKRLEGNDRFDMAEYVSNLVRLGNEAAEEARAVAMDHAAISSGSPVFSEAVFKGTWPADTYPQDLLHTYLLKARIGRTHDALPSTGLRRPRAGFNPIIYAEDQLPGDRATEPLTHWLSQGKPEGRWTHRLIELTPDFVQPVAVKALLHGHFYYADLIDDFLTRINRNASTIDLVLTVPDETRAETVRQAINRQPVKGSIDIRVTGNSGRDIGPFLTGLDRETLGRYDVIGHVHGKKSPHVEPVTGDQWRTFLWEHIIGGKSPAADICIAALANDPRLGLVFPEDANLHGWDANLDIATPLARRMGRQVPLPVAFEWPIGTMFWARREALAPLFDLNLDWSDYPKEPLPGDGTLLHALERLIPFAVEQAGFGYAASHLEEVQR